DPCPHVAGESPQSFAVKKLVLAFPGGAGGGNDRVKRMTAVFPGAKPFDLVQVDDLRGTLGRADAPGDVVFSAGTRAADRMWQPVVGRPNVWALHDQAASGDALQTARLKRISRGGVRNKLTLKSTAANLAGVPLARGEALRAVVEVSDGSFTGSC